MIKTNLFRMEEFSKFHNQLMKNAPTGYEPYYFILQKNGKDPDAKQIGRHYPTKSHCCQARTYFTEGYFKDYKKLYWFCSECNQELKKYSWKEPHARLNYNQVIGYIMAGFNIGIAATSNDPLILIDIDDYYYTNQMPETLICQSRTRFGIHGYCFDTSMELKKNIPTSTHGEIRADWQYVVAPGSYVPVSKEDLIFKVKEGVLPQEELNKILNDPLLGFYTVKDMREPKRIIFEDLPVFFKKVEEKETYILNYEETNFCNSKNKHPLYKLTYDKVLPKGFKSNHRFGHPIHDSDTGTNFMISKPWLACCWRCNVTLTVPQFLAVKSGYLTCNEAGNTFKKKGEGNIRDSKFNNDWKAHKAAFEEAVRMGVLQ